MLYFRVPCTEVCGAEHRLWGSASGLGSELSCGETVSSGK